MFPIRDDAGRVIAFGGRIAEEMFCGDVNTGALGDIRQATGLARKMVRDWGMNDRLGFVYYGEDDNKMSMFDMGGGREYSEETAKAIDEEIKKLIDGQYEETRRALSAGRSLLVRWQLAGGGAAAGTAVKALAHAASH